jgi:hypothetical protein
LLKSATCIRRNTFTWVYIILTHKYGDLALQVGGDSIIRTIKYGLESRGTDWRGPAATVNYRPVLSSERALQDNKPTTVERKFQGEKLVAGPRWVPDTQTDWPTDLSVVM